MRTIIIEPAPNGWIVSKKDYSIGCLSPVVGVYVDIGSLQAALPVILGADIPIAGGHVNAPLTNQFIKQERSYQESLRNLREARRPGGDRTPETIGGTELTPSS